HQPSLRQTKGRLSLSDSRRRSTPEHTESDVLARSTPNIRFFVYSEESSMTFNRLKRVLNSCVIVLNQQVLAGAFLRHPLRVRGTARSRSLPLVRGRIELGIHEARSRIPRRLSTPESNRQPVQQEWQTRPDDPAALLYAHSAFLRPLTMIVQVF